MALSFAEAHKTKYTDNLQRDSRPLLICRPYHADKGRLCHIHKNALPIGDLRNPPVRSILSPQLIVPRPVSRQMHSSWGNYIVSTW